MRDTFLQNRHQDQFEQEGYVLFSQFLPPAVVEALRQQYFQWDHDLGVGFHATMHSHDISYRKKVHQSMVDHIQPHADKVLKNYRPLVANYTVKEVGEESFFDFHLDWNMVDERKSRSVTIWVALDDTDAHNGNLWILEQSHRLPATYRCGPGLRLMAQDDDLFKHKKLRKRALPMKAGDAIIYDHKLFHGSPPNLSDSVRIGLNYAMAPREIPAIHYLWSGGPGDVQSSLTLPIEAREVEDEFFLSCIINDSGAAKKHTLSLEVIEETLTAYSQEEVNQHILDIDQERLRQKGYQVLGSLFDQQRMQRWIDWAEEHIIQVVKGYDFYTSHWEIPGCDTEKVHEYFIQELGDQIKAWFPADRPALFYALVKQPNGDNEVFPHQDWSIVDESLGRSYLLWIPLTTPKEGAAIDVLAGSHRFFPQERGRGIASVGDLLHPMEGIEYTSLSINPGEALLRDHGLVHQSPQFVGENPRLVLGVTLIPKEQPIQLAERTDGRSLQANELTDIAFRKARFNPQKDVSKQPLVMTFPFGKSYVNDRLRAEERPIFHRDIDQEEFFTRGFITTPLLDSQNLASCLEVFSASHRATERDKYNSLDLDESERPMGLYDQLWPLLEPSIARILSEYKAFGVNFAVKTAESQATFTPHIDDIHADESCFTGVNCWIPLVDVNENNGGLYFIEGSHRLDLPIRGIGLPFPFESYSEKIASQGIPLELKAGTGIFFHSKIIHGSPMNQSGKDRPAIIVGLLPNEAKPIVHMRFNGLDASLVETFETTPDFYEKVQVDERPNFVKSLGRRPHGLETFDPSIIENFLT